MSGGGVKLPWNKWRGPRLRGGTVYAAKGLEAAGAPMLCGHGWGRVFNPTPRHAKGAGFGAEPQGLDSGF